jgi:uncharacterized protein with HEPN domain
LSSDESAYLLDIVDNCERIAAYVVGFNQEQFDQDERSRDAVERCLQRISEAATRPDRASELAPEQPWSEIRGMGNWLRRAYDRLDSAIVWDVGTCQLPRLLADVQTALGEI